VADVTEGTVLAVVEIAATAERVFQAFTRPEEVVQWWGSAETYRTTEWTADPPICGWADAGVPPGLGDGPPPGRRSAYHHLADAANGRRGEGDERDP
jgi:hypothetical protein